MASEHPNGLHAARLRADMSQQKLADEVGQSYVTISRYESRSERATECRTRSP